jgi:DNA replication and repair protein RecF
MFTSLHLQQFRNYTQGMFEFEDGVSIIVGPNGSGKTTIIEALHYISTGHSFRGADEDVLQHGAQWARADVLFDDGTSRTLKLQTQAEKVVRTYELEGVVKKRFTQHMNLPLVLFLPQDMTILTGEPAARRDMLDAVLAAVSPGYEQNLKNYKRILQQRNALLKSDRTPRKDELFVWDLRLSEFGGVVHAARAAYIGEVSSAIQKAYLAITPKPDSVAAAYAYDVQGTDYAEGMLKQLAERYEKDVVRGFTTIGPHRDDLLLTINGADVRTAASRGETRSLLLALKLIEMNQLEKAFLVRPVVLLDDVFSELDGARRQSLAAALAGHQAFITTTDADLVMEHFSGKAHVVAL